MGTILFPVLLAQRISTWRTSQLNEFQFFGASSKHPVAGKRPHERDAFWARLIAEIKLKLRPS